MKPSNAGCWIAALWGAILFTVTPLRATEFNLENDQVVVTCETKGEQLLPGTLRDKQTGQTVKLGRDLFTLMLTNGAFIHSGEFKLTAPPRTMPLAVNAGASRLAEQLPGKELVAELSGRGRSGGRDVASDPARRLALSATGIHGEGRAE